ncbi:MAG: tetraacyldisaccharide 4'-kinase [Candidatus Zixiibacteriota bacterium]|nr:MAG: tetraacyldisaccharide 4'-kinase [candidate division Zixibacteria bacterium]
MKDLFQPGQRKKKGPLRAVALMFLSSFSLLYRLGCGVRVLLYRHGLRRQTKLPSKVISVGNITVGGTGKTPLVIYLTEKLKARGEKVAILTRGYKRKKKEMVELTQHIHRQVKWSDVGDEPYLLARRLSGIPIIVSKNRCASGDYAVGKHGTQTVVLDDGFQHLGLFRDLDVVVIDSVNPFGNGRLLPAGPLREPLTSLKRADVFVLTKTDQGSRKDKLIEILRRHNPKAPIVESMYEVRSIEKVSNGSLIPTSEVENKKVLAFSGIGNPLSFENTLRQLGIQILRHRKFSDHFAYENEDVLELIREAENLGLDLIITTEKDSVRIPLINEPKIPIYVLKIDLKVTSGEEVLLRKVKGKI